MSGILATLVACGAATDTSTSALPGTGGTGIYATGQITGFGSIILSQLKFDDQAADVRIDGVSSDPGDLRLGMVANIQGELEAGQTKGTARQIEVWSVAQGLASRVSTTQLTVGNLQFSVDAATVLEGFDSVQTIGPSTRLRVWGIPTDSAKGLWMATRIAHADNNDWVSTGQVQISAAGAMVNGFEIPTALAQGLSQGALVRVAVLISPSTGLPSIAVTDLSPSTKLHHLAAQVEGHVRAVMPGWVFLLDQVEVDASNAIFSPGPFYPAPGIHVVVDGVWESGQLKASTVTYRDANDLALVELSGKVQKFESLAKFYVRNTECDASVISNLDEASLTRLKEGASVKILGTKAGHTIKVYHLEFI